MPLGACRMVGAGRWSITVTRVPAPDILVSIGAFIVVITGAGELSWPEVVMVAVRLVGAVIVSARRKASRLDPFMQGPIEDDAIQPLADRHAGTTCGLARGLARLPPNPFDLPWNARFHARIRMVGTGKSGSRVALLEPALVNRWRIAARRCALGSQFFLLGVNRRLILANLPWAVAIEEPGATRGAQGRGRRPRGVGQRPKQPWKERVVPIYKAPVDDVLFLLDDVFQVGRYDNLPGFADASPDVRRGDPRAKQPNSASMCSRRSTAQATRRAACAMAMAASPRRRASRRPSSNMPMAAGWACQRPPNLAGRACRKS